ncbi:MAG: transporter [Bacteroidota bacterium]|nr:transporter [Bacteroidota bacterium]
MTLSAYLFLVCMSFSSAQTVNKFDFKRIEDNSFLMEEAYNQDPGVIQHISSFQYFRAKTWLYTFTDEWPVGGREHQLSATIPLLSNTGSTGIGDVEINYRYQAIFTDRMAFSPRFSLILPTGNFRKGLGSGVIGYQLSFPFSYLLSRALVTHYNFGLTVTPYSKNIDGSTSNVTIINYGLSIIQFFNENFNFMLEVIGFTTFTKNSNTATQISNSVTVNPGCRFAINFKSGLQIVPGIALPLVLDNSKGVLGLFGYLSFEHPLWKPK